MEGSFSSGSSAPRGRSSDLWKGFLEGFDRFFPADEEGENHVGKTTMSLTGRRGSVSG